MEPIIEFKNFNFKYRAQTEPTLYDINLTIYPGEKVLIVGPSGSGKSTLSNCINGLVPFFYQGDVSGEYYIKGQDPAKLGIFGLSKYVGTVLQDTDGQFIGLTVAEDIAFAMENDLVDQEEMKKRVAATADIVEVSKLLEYAPTRLSGGQKQRVSIAGVMVGEEEILLLDEPLASLDPATGKKTMALVDDIRQSSGRTIIVIEHRLEDALYRDMDRIILMSEGRIVADMSPDELLASDLLEKHGIREPLYVSAIKAAGCRIDAADRPQHIETMNLAPYVEAVRNWYETTEPEHHQVSEEDALKVENIDFSYIPGNKVLSDITFSVKKGEMLAIAGKNGSGKTTMSNLICGFIVPDKGTIYLDGRDIAPLSVKERGERIGMVMQNPNQMISKTMISEEVGLGLQVRGVPEEEIKERVNETLKICGLYPFRNWPISALSYGQKKRVTIASILVLKPDIMILDEPTAGQDRRHYTEIMEFVKKINEDQGITIIMITHDMHLMLEYADRAVVIADGELIANASPADVLSDENITDRAYLKKTSLYDLAVECKIDEPESFVARFISSEKEKRRAD